MCVCVREKHIKERERENFGLSMYRKKKENLNSQVLISCLEQRSAKHWFG